MDSGWFNRFYDTLQNKYKSKITFISNRKIRFLLIYLILCGGLVFVFSKLPNGFISKEDQCNGSIYTSVRCNNNRTDEVGKQKTLLRIWGKNTKYIFIISGFNFSG